jgi:hypothetical protein
MKRPTGVRFLLAASAVVLVLSVQACSPSNSYPSPPVNRFVPTAVGVMDRWTGDFSAIVLTDGRTIEARTSAGVGPLSPAPATGTLVLAGTTPSRWLYVMNPIQSFAGQCWEPWPDQTEDRIAWDLGDSILLLNGLELPKAGDFTSSAHTKYVDGRQAWVKDDQSAMEYQMCANSTGAIAWVKYAN